MAFDGLAGHVAVFERKHGTMKGRHNILVVGDDWPGSNVRFMARALERVGASVSFLGQDRIVPIWQTRALRGVARLLSPWLHQELNNRVLEAARAVQPQAVFVAAGHYLEATTIQRLQSQGAKVICLYFDVRWRLRDSLFQHTLGLYDAVGSMRAWHEAEFKQAGSKKFFLTRFGFCKESHFSERVEGSSSQDIVFIGTAEKPRDRYLALLQKNLPTGARLRIYGGFWQGASAAGLGEAVVGYPVVFPAHMRAIYAQCALALHFLGWDPDSDDPAMRRGDQHNSRTFQIPASGAPMLAQRTDEHDKFFEHEKEYLGFRTPDELVSHVHTLFSDRQRCENMAQAGHQRAINSDYSYDPVAKSLLQVFETLT